MRITYGGSNCTDILTDYCDCDFDMDQDDRKSRFGFFLMLNRGPVA